jgi:hypothetical protein
MTLDDAVALLQDEVGDWAGLIHTVPDLKNLLEAGANDVAALTLGYERSVIFRHTDSPQALAHGVREYLLSGPIGELGLGRSDVLKVLHIHVNGIALVQITPDQYTQIDHAAPTGGTPHYWYEFAGTVGFKPYPNTTFLASYEMELTYAASVGNWTSGESVLPLALQDLSRGPAYIKAKMREGQWQEAATAFNAWFEQVQTQTATVQRPITQKSDLRLASTEQRRLRRRTA